MIMLASIQNSNDWMADLNTYANMGITSYCLISSNKGWDTFQQLT